MRRVLAAADAAAQLVQLGDAEPIGVEDHHHRRVRHVDADLDHRRGDEHVELARAERLHHRLLLRRRQPAVQQPEPQPVQLAVRAAARRSPRPTATSSFSLSSISGHTTYAWRPAATSSRTSAHDRGFHRAARLRPVRDDRRAARRQLVEHADVEVAVDRHRRGARDRRRRHHQHVGHGAAVALVAQRARCSTPKRCCSSMTTTPRLWNATPSWISAWVPITMSTVPSARPASTSRAIRAGDPVGQQLDPQRPIAEQVVGGRNRHAVEHAPHAGRVLLGEHLGRRHQRTLVPALHGREHRADGHHRLAGTHVALQQPVHRMRAGEIALDLADRPPLRPVSSNGKAEYRRAVNSPSTLWRIALDSRSSIRLRLKELDMEEPKFKKHP